MSILMAGASIMSSQIWHASGMSHQGSSGIRRSRVARNDNGAYVSAKCGRRRTNNMLGPEAQGGLNVKRRPSAGACRSNANFVSLMVIILNVQPYSQVACGQL